MHLSATNMHVDSLTGPRLPNLASLSLVVVDARYPKRALGVSIKQQREVAAYGRESITTRFMVDTNHLCRGLDLHRPALRTDTGGKKDL